MDFYRYDGTSCLLYVDGKPYAYVTRSNVVDIIEAINSIILIRNLLIDLFHLRSFQNLISKLWHIH